MLLCLYMVWYEIIQVLILLFKLVWFCPLFVLVMRFHSLSFLPSVKVSFRYYWFEVKTLKSNPRLLVFDKENSEYYFSCVSPLYQDYSGKWSIFPFIESRRHTSWWFEIDPLISILIAKLIQYIMCQRKGTQSCHWLLLAKKVEKSTDLSKFTCNLVALRCASKIHLLAVNS